MSASWVRLSDYEWEIQDPPVQARLFTTRMGLWFLDCESAGIIHQRLAVNNPRDAMVQAQFEIVRKVKDVAAIATRWPAEKPA